VFSKEFPSLKNSETFAEVPFPVIPDLIRNHHPTLSFYGLTGESRLASSSPGLTGESQAMIKFLDPVFHLRDVTSIHPKKTINNGPPTADYRQPTTKLVFSP
jgi:hypothetical protein